MHSELCSLLQQQSPCPCRTMQKRRSIRSELRSLLKEERQRQQKAVEEVLKHASVVCATLTRGGWLHPAGRALPCDCGG